MHHDFWHKRWSTNDIGFHEAHGNHLLKKYYDAFLLPAQTLVMVPLCGKTRDIAWLLSRGCQVVAIELNEQAVLQLFAELGAEPKREQKDAFIHYYLPDLSVYVGDFFKLKQAHIGKPDLIFDRGALVALPDDLRSKYSEHLQLVAPSAVQFLICYQYSQSLFKGPPFNVSEDNIRRLYSQKYTIAELYRGHVEGGFRSQSEVFEAVYALSPK